MKLTRDQIVRLALLGSAVLAMLLLIAGISGVELEPGLPFSRIWAFLIGDFTGFGGAPVGGEVTATGRALVDIVRAIFFVALVAFPFALILIMVDPVARKRMLRAILQIAVLLVLFNLFVQNQALEIEGEERQGSGMPTEEGSAAVDPLTDEEFDPATIPAWLVWGASLGFGLLIAVMLIVVINQIRKSRPDEEVPLVEIARRAQSAIDEIERGGNLRATILRCYAEMSRVVREERGLRRDRAVTAREFTDYLIGANLPKEPVVRLTRLFEKARYSGSTPTSSDEEEALASLQAIVDACIRAKSPAPSEVQP
jgi:hypothetical protein